jgi:probable O-glycosylation ligase (exosortase A-associated)
LIRSLFLTVIYLTFFGLGMAAPFVFTLGYAWVDTFRPQSVAMIILNQVPVALIMGVAALGGYFAMDRRSPPRLTLATALTLLMGFWITASMFWAERPDVGWGKWDWAFKTVMFSAFIPLVIRSRVQIEAFAQTYVFSLAANFVPFGLKTMISGGGYGHNLGLEGGNSNLAEGGLLSTICLMAIPLALHLGRHTQLLPRSRLVPFAYAGLCLLALVTALGTFERSALIGLLVLGAYMFTRSRHKVVYLACLAVISVVLVYTMSAGYDARIATISDPTKETSALTRLLVWKYTFNYALSHPFGGGFMAYLVDRIEFPTGEVVFGRAYHSIYFEVLGEQGWVGLALFLGTALWTFFDLRRMARRARKLPHLAWCVDMSDALQSGLAVFMTAAAFVGIAYQPAFWYFIAMSVSLREYVRRVEQGQPATGWRARSLAAQGMAPAATSAPPWRNGGRQDAARARAGSG